MTYPEKKVLVWTLIVVLGHIIGSLWLYRLTGWFDNFVHFLGGIWLALVLITFLKNLSSFEIVFVVFAAAVLWENFEGVLNWYATATYGFTTPVGGNTTDTISDIVLGILGAIVTVFYLQKSKGNKIVPE